MTREEAKAYIIRHCNPDYPEGKTEWETAINMAIKALEQPERKKGKWQRVSADKYRTSVSYLYKCDKCGEVSWFNSKFCSNCGADMREDEHEAD